MPLNELEAALAMATVSRSDRLYDRSMQVLMAIWSIYVAVAVALTALFPAITITFTVAGLPLALSLAVAAFLAVGSANILRGLFQQKGTLRYGWRIERSGLVISMSGWLAYGFATMLARSSATLIWTLSFVLVAASALRIIDIGRKSRRHQRNIIAGA